MSLSASMIGLTPLFGISFLCPVSFRSCLCISPSSSGTRFLENLRYLSHHFLMARYSYKTVRKKITPMLKVIIDTIMTVDAHPITLFCRSSQKVSLRNTMKTTAMTKVKISFRIDNQ